MNKKQIRDIHVRPHTVVAGVNFNAFSGWGTLSLAWIVYFNVSQHGNGYIDASYQTDTDSAGEDGQQYTLREP
jgi:hypothetical protein